MTYSPLICFVSRKGEAGLSTQGAKTQSRIVYAKTVKDRTKRQEASCLPNAPAVLRIRATISLPRGRVRGGSPLLLPQLSEVEENNPDGYKIRQLWQQGQHVVSVLLQQDTSATSEPHGKKVGFQPSFSSHIVYFQRSSGEQSSELAMPKLMQASLWSFGLTKTLSSLSKLSP